MKDVKWELQQAYYTLLTDAGLTVYERDGTPSEPEFPYVELSDITEIDDSDKSSFGSEVTYLLIVRDRVTSRGSKQTILSVLNTVKQTIRARPVTFNITGWNVISSVVDSESTLPKILEETYTYFGHQIRFRHIIQQQ